MKYVLRADVLPELALRFENKPLAPFGSSVWVQVFSKVGREALFGRSLALPSETPGLPWQASARRRAESYSSFGARNDRSARGLKAWGPVI
jgi:hypothetical protein